MVPVGFGLVRVLAATERSIVCFGIGAAAVEMGVAEGVTRVREGALAEDGETATRKRTANTQRASGIREADSRLLARQRNRAEQGMPEALNGSNRGKLP
jgi:hypothetical protein